MTQKQGHLYTSAGASHPDARRALPERSRRRSSRVERDRELFGFNTAGFSDDGLNTKQIFRNILIVTVFFALIDSFWHHSIGLLTTIPFAVISIMNAWRTSHKNVWAGWTAPPLVFALVSMLSSFITHQALGRFPIAQITALILVLSVNTWAVLFTTAVCWFLVRRIDVKHRNELRRERRQRAEIDAD